MTELNRCVAIGAMIVGGFACNPGSQPQSAPKVNSGGLCSEYRDSRVVDAFTELLSAIARKGLPDEDGLVERNHIYGQMISPRFQMGSGVTARVAVILDNQPWASEALRAIEVGLATVDSTGMPVSKTPPDAPLGSTMTAGDVAQAASFFLGDACLGLIALEQAPAEWNLARRTASATVIIRDAMVWLSTQEQVLASSNAAAPNRLLFDVRAFAACGELTGDDISRQVADRFVDRVLALQRTDGVFVEGGGHDTSYQGVAIMLGYDVLTLCGSDRYASLQPAVMLASAWLAARVDDQGRVDSSGNTRTCEGGETFLGQPKSIDLAAVSRGLASIGTCRPDDEIRDAASRIHDWDRANPGADPCFP